MTVNDAFETAAPDEGQPDTGNASVEDYSTRGQTTVATRRGWRFAPSDKDLPVVTHAGVKVTSEQARSLVQESGGLVQIVDDKEGE